METRKTYTASRRFEFGELWPRMLLMYSLAAVLATVYALLMEHGLYAVGFVWLFPAGLKIWLTRQTIRNSHCRNPLLAAFAIATVGLSIQLGSYHIDQCSRWGVEWHRVDCLPGYVTFRMESDEWWRLGKKIPVVGPLDAGANPNVVPYVGPRLEPNSHWLAFGMEFLLVVLMPTIAAWSFARRPYSERLNDWFREESVILNTPAAESFPNALRHGCLEYWLAARFDNPTEKPGLYKLRIWYCPKSAAESDIEPEVYIAIGDGPKWLLSPEEMAAMVEVFPGLSDWAEVPVERREHSLIDTPMPGERWATFRLVPPPHAGLCKDLFVKWRGRFLGMLVALGPIVPAAAFIGPVYPLSLLFARLGVPDLIVGYVVVGGLASLWLITRLNRQGNEISFYFLVWYYRRTMLRQARRRADTLFNVGDAEALYVDIIPRRIWAEMGAGAKEAETGFLVVDESTRRVLFEGDRYRWVIPFDAIRSWDAEELPVAQTAFHLAILRVETTEGIKELPFAVLTGLPGKDRFEIAAGFIALLDRTVGGARRPTAPLGAVSTVGSP